MKVLLAQSAGFCWGVKRAVDTARKLAEESNTPIYTDGPLIHNEQMIDQLRKEGVHETNDPGAIHGGHLLIRAHGIPPERRNLLQTLDTCLVDATCPDVAKIQGTIRRYARNGFSIIIFGDRGHAEVLGLQGYAQGKGFVVRTTGEVEMLAPDIAPVAVVSQSTQFPAAYAKITTAVRQRFPEAVVIDTICEATLRRQQEVLELSRRVDAFVVVGGAHSANTLRLVDLAGSLKPTFHIQTSAQLDAAKLRDMRTVALTAGASTPAFIIEKVKNALEDIGR